MKIQPVVEGYGEVSAVPVLLRRLGQASGAFDLEVCRPIRRKRWELVNEAALRRSIRLALLQECNAILVLFDGDDDCPKTLGPRIQACAQEEACDIPCAVVIAHREYEAWFLGAIESLRGLRGVRSDAVSLFHPEDIRDAKGKLEDYMAAARRYSETTDQPALTAKFDLAAAHRSSRSFRRMVKAFGTVLMATGGTLPEWPPPQWDSERS